MQDINYAFITVLSPNKIRTLYDDLEGGISSLESNDSAILNAANITNYLNQATLHYTSIESFINILNQYRYWYPDIVEPLYSNIMELLYGIKMKIDLLRKLILQHKYLLSEIHIQNRLTNLIKFPTLHENQSNIGQVIDNYMNNDMHDFIAASLSIEEDSYSVKLQKLR